MDAQHTIVRIYLFVCRHYRGRLAATVQRQSNNDQPDFTDEEVLTIYLFGLFKKRETVSEIHKYAEDHFSDWFPALPSYQSYNRRLNRLNAVFSPLAKRPTCRKGPAGNRLQRAQRDDAPHRRFDADYDGQWTEGVSSEGRLRADRGRRLLFLEGYLLPRSRGFTSSLNAGAISSRF